ncbi:MAG: LLM class flavin-dependent oxidoreductase, partial [Myxococcota bacterium]
IRIAEEVASLDHLSGGRVILGLGRGFRPALFSAFGIDPKEKRDRFDASLDLILAAWRGEPVTASGTGLEPGGEAANRRLRPPLQQPHPPLAVAAFGSKGLAQAAQRGLPYLASPMEAFDQIRENLEIHRQGMPAEQMPGHSVVPIMRTVFVSQTDSSSQRVLMALEAENRNARGMRGGRTPKVIARAMSAPIEERVVVGQAAKVTDQLARYRRELGMNLMVIRPQVSGTEESERLDALDRLIEEVMPALT